MNIHIMNNSLQLLLLGSSDRRRHRHTIASSGREQRIVLCVYGQPPTATDATCDVRENERRARAGGVRSPKEILQVTPDFVELLGLKQSLTPSRNNGFLNMLRLMQKKTLALVAAQDQVRSPSRVRNENVSTSRQLLTAFTRSSWRACCDANGETPVV